MSRCLPLLRCSLLCGPLRSLVGWTRRSARIVSVLMMRGGRERERCNGCGFVIVIGGEEEGAKESDRGAPPAHPPAAAGACVFRPPAPAPLIYELSPPSLVKLQTISYHPPRRWLPRSQAPQRSSAQAHLQRIAAPRSKGERHQPDRTNRKRERSPRRSPPIPIERPSLLSQDESRTR